MSTEPETTPPTVRMGHLHDLALGRCKDPACWVTEVPEGVTEVRRLVHPTSRVFFGRVPPTREATFRRDQIVLVRKDRLETWDLWLERD